MKKCFLGATLLLATACAPGTNNPAILDSIAQRYVVLVLSMGHHDPNYVDAYYGPDSLNTIADSEKLSAAMIAEEADSLIGILGDSVPQYADSMDAMRHRYLRTQLGSMTTRLRMLGGEVLDFDTEAMGLYGARPPHMPDSHFDSLLAELDSVLPGGTPLAQRYQSFRSRVMIPAELVDTVFKVAISACRARTMEHMDLPPGEEFDLEYVKGTSWNAYNWYKGNYRSLIQVNLDFPIAVDRAIDLACHEGYPGHHVYNSSLERALVNGRGWVEMSVYPLFSPQSLIAEGSANFGIEMAFPGASRTAFERDSLFPLAGLDPALAEQNAQVREIITALNFARNEVARKYLDGGLDSAGAVAAMERYWLQEPIAAAKTLRFIRDYRSYVINYNLGAQMVADYVERESGGNPDRRWDAFAGLLASPKLPEDL